MKLIDKYPLEDPQYNFQLNKFEIIVGTLAINLLSLALPIMVLQVYDRIMVNYSYNTLFILSLIVFLAIALEAFMRSIRSYATGWAATLYEYALDANAVRKYIHADPDRLRLEGVGKRVQTLNSFSKLKDFHSGQALILMIDIPFAFIFLMLIFYIAGSLVLVPIVLISVFSAINWDLGNSLMKALQKQEDDDDDKYNFVIESLRGVHSIKSYGLEFLFKRKFEALEEKSSMSSYDASTIHAKGRMYGILFTELMVVLIVAFGAPMVIASNLTTGGLVATTLLAGRLMQPVQKSLVLWDQYQEYKIANNKAKELFDLPQIVRNSNTSECPKNGELTLRDTAVQLGKRVILEKCNLRLKAMDVVAVHGGTTTERNSLIKLIVGLTAPSTGDVLLDGISAGKFSSENLVKHVGLVESEGIVFQGSIIDNLTGFDSKKEQAAKEIANMLGLHKYINSLPKGYETKINDGLTDVISPGVKQKISIARVLLHDPKIILFNNADKGLDSEGYDNLLALMKKFVGKASMVLITEDKNFYSLASKHYLIKDKKLSETKRFTKKTSKLNNAESVDK